MSKIKCKIPSELRSVANKLVDKGYQVNNIPIYTLHKYSFNIYNDIGYELMILFTKSLGKTNWHCSMYKDHIIIYRDNHSQKSLEEDVQDLERCIDNICPRNTVIA